MKTRQAFYLHTTKLTRLARRLCREILRPRHAARHPYVPINSAAIKAECECAPARHLPAPGRQGQAGSGPSGVLCPSPCPARRHGPAARSLAEPAGAEAGRAETPGSCAPVPR